MQFRDNLFIFNYCGTKCTPACERVWMDIVFVLMNECIEREQKCGQYRFKFSFFISLSLSLIVCQTVAH
jgi:hypothetical protein